MSYYQKYRPVHFKDVVGQDSITYILANQVKRRKVANSYLFAGPSGTGKTTCARIMANALAGSNWDITEIDSARLLRGIEEVKELVYKANFGPLGGAHKVWILDEVHELSSAAWNGLLKTLEEPPPYLIIILCTTKLSAIPETVRSRCQLFEFQAINEKATLAKLQIIVKRERLGVTNEAVRFIAGMASGNLRIAEGMLEQVVNLDHGSPRTKDIKKFLQAKII
ncbi:MAG: AAA family ATPase [Dehalococcoidales bacterium]|nr:AAA family ATPase [Dehalococcoidales bacterium]